jgi:hypothetical protein
MVNNNNKERKHTAIFLLTILQAVINEQIEIRQLKRDVGSYIYEAVKEQAHKLGYLENENKG